MRQIYRYVLLASTALAFAPTLAQATPCPNIMLILDSSGSMDNDPTGGNAKPSKWDILVTATTKILTKYSGIAPFGLEIFSSSGFDDSQCYSDTQIAIEPAHGTSARISSKVKGTSPMGGTNTGDAIKRAAADKAMQDPSRGQFLILITDGDPNCNGGEPNWTVQQIQAAAKQKTPIKTFIIGFGQAGASPTNLNNMAVAGQEPSHAGACTNNAPCFYDASNAASLDMALEKILNQVVSGGEFANAMQCDDSCYSTGCPAGQICTTDELNTMPHCAADPCANAVNPCSGTDFCRGGSCVPSCPACPSGAKCISGNCAADLCTGVQCTSGQACNPASGECQKDPCTGLTCRSGQYCDISTNGHCVDDSCSVVTCPEGTACKVGGNCESLPAAGGPGGSGGTASRGGTVGGCDVASNQPSSSSTRDWLIASIGAFLAMLSLVLRRRHRRP